MNILCGCRNLFFFPFSSSTETSNNEFRLVLLRRHAAFDPVTAPGSSRNIRGGQPSICGWDDKYEPALPSTVVELVPDPTPAMCPSVPPLWAWTAGVTGPGRPVGQGQLETGMKAAGLTLQPILVVTLWDHQGGIPVMCSWARGEVALIQDIFHPSSFLGEARRLEDEVVAVLRSISL